MPIRQIFRAYVACLRYFATGRVEHAPVHLRSIGGHHYSDEMIRGWLDAKEAVVFARGVARDIDRLFPREGSRQQKAFSAKKELKKLDSIALRTRTFAQGHKLNVYKKAKLLNTIKWELRDAGHEDALINEIVAFLAPLLA